MTDLWGGPLQQHDIFISYKRGYDEDRVAGLVGALRANGFSVWWDRDIAPNAPWEETIQAALHAAIIAIVCWSPRAAASENVRAEARWAKERNKLLQVYVEKCEPPLFFGEHQALTLLDQADLYGPKFLAVRDAVRRLIEHVDAAESEAAHVRARGKRTEDPLALTWALQEPAARWEASQFGLTLAVIALAIGVGTVVHARAAFTQIPSFADTIVTNLYSGAIFPFATLFSGWVAYLFLGRRPRRVRLIRGVLLAGMAGLTGWLINWATLIVGVWISELLPAEVSSDSFPNMDAASVTLNTAFVLPFLWLPIWLLAARRLLRRVAARVAVAAIVVLAPLSIAIASFVIAAKDAEAENLVEQIDHYIRLAGWARVEDLAATPFSRETIARVQRDLDLQATGVRTQAMLNALYNIHAEKRTWRLAADGSGDARSINELIGLSAGNIDVVVSPGIYRETLGDNDLSNLFNAHDDKGPVPTPRSIFVHGEPGRREDIVFEVHSTVRLGQGSSLTGVTIRGPPYDGPISPIVELYGAATLRDSILEGGQVWAVSILPAPPLDALDRAALFRGEQASRNGALVEGNDIRGPRQTAIAVRAEGRADIIGNHFPAVSEWCVDVASERLTAIRDNDMSTCLSTGRGAIRAEASAVLRVSNNVGANDAPILVRGEDGEPDYVVH